MINRWGQLLNIPAIRSIPSFFSSLAIPHYHAETINDIDFALAKKLGFEGVVYDKDNTLTTPLAEGGVYDLVKPSFEESVEIFGANNILIGSNSIGTNDDEGYQGALDFEEMLDGVRVIRRGWHKKPWGQEQTQDMLEHSLSSYIMVGDRNTDIIFGNKGGMLTILTDPFTSQGDIKGVSGMRKFERKVVDFLSYCGMQAPVHQKYDPAICSNDQSYRRAA